MNERAYQLYLSNGIDLEKDLLRIDVCAQHCNGGISCDENYMSKDIKNLFVCGECSGTFGIARPGGTALNNTQVSSLRAAEYISRNCCENRLSYNQIISLTKEKVHLVEDLSKGTKSITEILKYRKQIGDLMSQKCSFVRSTQNAIYALNELTNMKESFVQDNATTSDYVKEALINYDLLVSAIAVAYAQKIYCESKMKSRGSYLICENNNLNFSDVQCENDVTSLFNIYLKQTPTYIKSTVSPIPESEQWFEKVYGNYYESK